MEHEPSFDGTHAGLELRVLAGPQAGARAALHPGHVCVLAAGPDGDGADIVLRDESGTPVRVRMVAGHDMAMIEVLDGPVTLDEQPVAAGESTPWPMHARLQVGSSVVAFGPAANETWPEEAAAAAAPSEGIEADTAEPLRPPKRSRAPWLVGLCLLLAVASVAGVGFTQVLARATPAQPPISIADAMRTSEFASLALAHDASGRPELRGRLATLAERTKLDTWLAARQFTPAVNVFVDEAVARDVTEVFRVNGVGVQASVKEPGHIVATASERDEERLARAAEVVRRDVRGLQKLGVANSAPPAPPPPPPPVIDDPGKRIASVVPGNPAYIVTVDGARYFVGAMLPTGHRITAIAGQRVSLELNGEAIALNL